MNKRQKRKQFKKRWGMNPEEYEEMSIKVLQEGLAKLPEVVKEATQIIKRAWPIWQEKPQRQQNDWKRPMSGKKL